MIASASRRGLVGARLARAGASIRVSAPFESSERLQGVFRSSFAGSGSDPADSRPWAAGDDLSRVDIAATIRNGGGALDPEGRGADWGRALAVGSLYLRRGAEERLLPAIVAVDASRSLMEGSDRDAEAEASFSTTKAAAAIRLAGFLGYTAIASGFSLGALVSGPDGGPPAFLPPVRSGSRIGMAVSSLESAMLSAIDGGARAGSFPEALGFAAAVLRGRSFVFALSDFEYGPEELARLVESLAALSASHAVVPVLLRDSRLPASRLSRVEGRRPSRRVIATDREGVIELDGDEGPSAPARSDGPRLEALIDELGRRGLPVLRIDAAEGADGASRAAALESYMRARFAKGRR